MTEWHAINQEVKNMSLFEKFKKKESIPQSQPSTDKIYSSYNIDGWYIQLPQEWKMTLDKENEQVIFDVDNEAVNIYISTFNFEKTETGEKANIEAVASFALQAFKLQGAEEYEIFSKYYPEGFATYTSKSITTDKYTMIACIVCTEGHAFAFYVVGDENIDFEKYIQHINSVERDL